MSMIIKPYGDKDPYAEISLIASTKVHSEIYTEDQLPVLAARTSHAGSGKTGDNPAADIKLMSFLADHRHMTPFEHQSATFLVTAPIFVIREWHRHRTQAYSEMSMRYTDDPVGKCYVPQIFRSQAVRNKQSSAGPIRHQTAARAAMQTAYDNALNSYNELLAMGVCREQARAVVPVGNYSSFYATANLRNWAGFCTLRTPGDAQWEIRMYAKAVDDMLLELWPESWGCLRRQFEGKIA